MPEQGTARKFNFLSTLRTQRQNLRTRRLRERPIRPHSASMSPTMPKCSWLAGQQNRPVRYASFKPVGYRLEKAGRDTQSERKSSGMEPWYHKSEPLNS
ncbi:MAG: hypothetical protein CBB70_10510, partial [Planctomycetaceae bacterium TMED10]